MSVITNDSCFENNLHQPSLIYPSLINKQQQQKAQEDSKQTCIHFASRLIKLRSELRSPFYMRQQNGISGDSDNLRPSISRVQSLPSLYIPDEHPYIHHLDDCDESEIQSPIEVSPTHRRTLHTGPKAIRNGLALPPKQDFFLNENSNSISSINNNNNHLITKRSISLHNILTNDHKSLSSSRPIITNRFESQLYYNHSPSQNQLKLQLQQQQQQRQQQQQQMQQQQQKQQQENKKGDDEKKGNCCCTCKKNILPTTPPPVPTSSLSHETTKSLFSTMSSDSEDDDESIVFHPKKTVIRRRAATTTAFFVTISPSSAAAASVAKGRRCNKRRSQQTISSST